MSDFGGWRRRGTELELMNRADNKTASKCLMIVHSYFPEDVRVNREAASLGEIGIQTDVICLKNKGEKRIESFGEFRAFRLPVRRDRTRGPLAYLFEYLSFLILSFFVASLLLLRHKYRFVHVHNIPNILVLSAVVAKLRGIPVVLDMHEVMPEFFIQRFGEKKNSLFGGLITLEEKISIRIADVVIVAGSRLKSILRSRGYTDKEIIVVTNAPDEKLFRVDMEETNHDAQRFTICYHGALSSDYPLDTTVLAIARLKALGLAVFLTVIGDGVERGKYEKLSAELGVVDRIEFVGRVPLKEIPRRIAACDAGIVPVADDEYNNTGIPTKLYEYVILRKPVLVSEVAAVRDVFSDDELIFFRVDDVNSLVEGIQSVLKNCERMQDLVNNALNVYTRERWEIQKKKYHSLIAGFMKA
jgi:glycosyltransferase involved in cell wall biosynthesis